MLEVLCVDCGEVGGRGKMFGWKDFLGDKKPAIRLEGVNISIVLSFLSLYIHARSKLLYRWG